MGSKAPPVPKEQLSDKIHGSHSPRDIEAGVSRDPSRDQSGLNLEQQGRYGNAKQNLTPQHKTQNR